MFKKFRGNQRTLYTGKQEKVMYATKKWKEQKQRERAFMEYDIVRSKAGIGW